MTISWLELNLILFDLFSYSVFTHLNCQSILQIFVSDKILHRIIELSFVYKQVPTTMVSNHLSSLPNKYL